jgi:hypothetical protein
MPAPPAGYYKAMLVPEPGNPYDPNAIAVVLWAGHSWTHSGYLSKDDALRYRPLMQHLGRGGKQPAIACDAAIVWERGERGVVLHLGTPGECIVELVTDELATTDHLWGGQLIAFTGRLRTTIHGVLLDREAQLMVAAWAGCDVAPRVTKKVQTLVAAEVRDPSANALKAREYAIPVVAEPDFLRSIGIPAEAIGTDDLAWART